MIMKKKSIIYGVNGMLEYQALIKVGSARMPIHFCNGSSNEAGRTPATFITSDPIVQLAIENSREFKSGLIRIVHSVATGEDVYIESDHVGLAGEAAQASGVGTKSEVATPAECETPAPVVTGDQKEDAVDTVTEMKFSCNDDAKDYLEKTFGVKRTHMLNRASIIAEGKANGIEVVFTD